MSPLTTFPPPLSKQAFKPEAAVFVLAETLFRLAMSHDPARRKG